MRDSADNFSKGRKADIPEPALLSQGGLAGVQPILYEEENEDSWPANESEHRFLSEESLDTTTSA